MKDSFYFPHDYHARHDPKLERLRMEIGPVGDGIYWDLVEMLYEERGYLPLKDIPVIAKTLNVTPQLVTKVIKESKLFIVSGSKFYSDSLLERLKHINAKRKKAKDNAEKRWGKPEGPRNPKRGIIFYLVRIWSDKEQFLKAGITSESVRGRLSGNLKGYDYEILFNKVLSQSLAFKVEEKLHQECKKYVPEQKIPGYLECYSIDEKDRILAVMQTHCQGNAIKESKGKESKEKKNIRVYIYLNSIDFQNAFNDYLEMRKKIRKPATDRAIELALAQLHKYPVEVAIKMLEQSIMNSWQGIFELKVPYKGTGSQSRQPETVGLSDEAINNALGKIATKDMIKKFLRDVPQPLWHKVEAWLQKRYPGGGVNFGEIERELIQEAQAAHDKLMQISKGIGSGGAIQHKQQGAAGGAAQEQT